jgi:hypothetical protein
MYDERALAKLTEASAKARDWTEAAIALDGLLDGPDDPAQIYLTALQFTLSVDPESDQQRRWDHSGQ